MLNDLFSWKNISVTVELWSVTYHSEKYIPHRDINTQRERDEI